MRIRSPFMLELMRIPIFRTPVYGPPYGSFPWHPPEEYARAILMELNDFFATYASHGPSVAECLQYSHFNGYYKSKE